MIYVYGPQRDRCADIIRTFKLGSHLRPIWNPSQLPSDVNTRVAFMMIANDPHQPPVELQDKLKKMGACVFIISLQWAAEAEQRAQAFRSAIDKASTLQ